MRFVMTLVSVLALSACGAMDQGKSAGKPVISEESAKAQSQALPAVTIVRVPVDASGKEMNEKAEMRLSSEKSLSQATVATVFSDSKAPDTFVDELDKSTSTESTCGWRRWYRNCNNCGNNYGYGYNYGYNYNYNYNWSFYRPTYYNYGYYYNWNYAQTYNTSNYNYYQYNSSFSNSYSGYGNAPGYPTQY
jgi:hypothetical protein